MIMSSELVRINPVVVDLVHSAQIEQSNPFTEEIFLIDFLVALNGQGMAIQELVSAIQPGDTLSVVRAEGFDVWLDHQGAVIGRVPLEISVVVARLMDAGKKIVCRVTSADVLTHKVFGTPFSRVLAKLFMVD